MTMALELLIFIGLFGLGMGLLGSLIDSTDRKTRELRAAHESQRFARQPWAVDRKIGRGNR
jgi:hypothetical protein